ncbi:MAG: phosphodiesterase [Pseudomonadales bacterium]|nr:phosphodiesterase [Pseudomonadales bacterium]NRA14842.1 phosphodiesterase [Oceanospirillaceae bacterium]
MLKMIHLTDTHLVEKGKRLFGLDPHARLKLAIEDINRSHKDANCAFITGDLTNWGTPEEYTALADALSKLQVPLHLLLGNHDNRENFKAAFPNIACDVNGYVQSSVDTDQGRLIFLDSLMEGTSSGWLCEDRLKWLENQLSDAAAAIYLFMHHPPFDVGIPYLDKIGLVQKEEFENTITPYKSRIRQIFFGHVHRPIHGEWLGIPFSTLRGTNHQVWLNMPFQEDHQLEYSYEAPCYGVVLIDAQKTLIHTHEYMYCDDIYSDKTKDLKPHV